MISILMPAFNAESYLKDSINSILNQSYTDFELLVCDDCSTDNTWEIMQSIQDARLKIFQNKENQGYLKTSNFLVSHAVGEYISFQDADDLCTPDRLFKLHTYLVENGLDLVGSYCGIFLKKDKLLSVVKYSTEHKDIVKDLLEKNHPPFCGSAVMVKSEVVKKCGLYSINFDRIGAEDFDWIYRVALSGFKLGNFPEPLYLYRQHVQSVTRLNYEKNQVSLFSELIAKNLYLARVNNLQHDFEYFKNEFINDTDLYVDLVNYKILRNSFLGSKKELLKNLYLFLFNVRRSREKILTLFSALCILVFNYEIFERIKNILKGMRS
ncbi:glycosyltransferase [Acinetobacter sp. ANC 4862]|uniref:glycosyltransferase family 2 protein n=1 Tax=Acinetobacter sp. ANC 4862 TaxID=2529849 RepID=UPI00103D6D0B|nr:glycosyltransferase [Acinetobacter sp. ANC 4862]TCH64086.1 glycosyltransferase [Acinetobacter sp. ANC 4862]